MQDTRWPGPRRMRYKMATNRWPQIDNHKNPTINNMLLSCCAAGCPFLQNNPASMQPFHSCRAKLCTYSDLNGNGKNAKREKKMLFWLLGWIRVMIRLFSTPLRFVQSMSSLNRKVYLQPLSKSVAFWGVHELSPGRFLENGREGYGWYCDTKLDCPPWSMFVKWITIEKYQNPTAQFFLNESP